MAADGHSASYSYLANSPLVEQIAFKQGTSVRMTTTKQHDFINRLTSIASVPSGAAPISFGYLYNNANQRTRANLADGSYWIYNYDALGQVISGKKHFGDNTPVPGQQFEYAFDDIGNRTTSKAGGDSSGAILRTTSYTRNLLNQYLERTVPGGFDVIGLADAGATVTINGSSSGVYRKDAYFRKELTVNNSAGPVWQEVTVSSSSGASAGPGRVFVPKTPLQYDDPGTSSVNEGFDADGNPLRDGRWNYTWDAENRLVKLESRSDAPAGSKRRLEFDYDFQGRRIRKVVVNLDTSQTIDEIRFVYDGWNLVAELNSNLTPSRSFVWGLDLSGSPQGAGGVGGLLMVRDHATSTHHFAAYDGNGNVAALIESAHGRTSAIYEYGPFGEAIRISGTMGKLNPLRFSTKYTDDETDFLYYGYRYYDPTVGRWLNRDPIGEWGGKNLYGAGLNDFSNWFDLLGLSGGWPPPVAPGMPFFPIPRNPKPRGPWAPSDIADALDPAVDTYAKYYLNDPHVNQSVLAVFSVMVVDQVARTYDILRVGHGTSTWLHSGGSWLDSLHDVGRASSFVLIFTPLKCNGPKAKYNLNTQGMSPAEAEAVKEYARRSNRWLKENGPQIVVGTAGDLRAAASAAARAERLRAARAGKPYEGQAGHVPDTAISGRADPPGGWLDMPGSSNQSAGGGLSHRRGSLIDAITVDGAVPPGSPSMGSRLPVLPTPPVNLPRER